MSTDNKKDPDADLKFEQRARAELRQAVAATTPQVRARLDAIVAAAAREAPRGKPWRRWSVALPVAGGITAASLAVILLLPGKLPPAQPAGSQADDLALLLNVDNLDLLERMEFYQWLEREPKLLEGDVTAPAGKQRS